MEKRFNKIYIGTIAGFILPVIVLVLFYFIRIDINVYTFFSFLQTAFHKGVYLQLISFCVFFNIVIFFIFIWFNYLRSARGVLLATLLFSLFVMIIKLFV
jgi:hypothetical protein